MSDNDAEEPQYSYVPDSYAPWNSSEKARTWKPKVKESSFASDWANRKSMPTLDKDWVREQYQQQYQAQPTTYSAPQSYAALPQEQVAMSGQRRSKSNQRPYGKQRAQWTEAAQQQAATSQYAHKPKYNYEELLRNYRLLNKLPKANEEWANQVYQTQTQNPYYYESAEQEAEEGEQYDPEESAATDENYAKIGELQEQIDQLRRENYAYRRRLKAEYDAAEDNDLLQSQYVASPQSSKQSYYR